MFVIQPHRARVEASQRHTRSSQWATPSLEESGDDDKEENAAQLFHYKCLIASSPRIVRTVLAWLPRNKHTHRATQPHRGRRNTNCPDTVRVNTPFVLKNAFLLRDGVRNGEPAKLVLQDSTVCRVLFHVPITIVTPVSNCPF